MSESELLEYVAQISRELRALTPRQSHLAYLLELVIAEASRK